MALVLDILRTKGSQVWNVQPDTSIREALELMADKNVGALVVVEGERVVGIISERDYARGASVEEGFSFDAPVKKLMSSPVFFVSPNQNVDDCMALMTGKRFRHLPVIEEGKLVGLISIGDLVKSELSEMDSTIKHLEDYIWIHMI